jgi:hypothetical protein
VLGKIVVSAAVTVMMAGVVDSCNQSNTGQAGQVIDWSMGYAPNGAHVYSVNVKPYTGGPSSWEPVSAGGFSRCAVKGAEWPTCDQAPPTS